METIAVKALSLRNAARGITPTATTFDTNPTDLANATDGNPTTVTGVGSKVTSGAGTFGYVYVDLGSVKTVLYGAKVGAYSPTGTVTLIANSSTDGNNYYAGASVGITSTTERLLYVPSTIVNARHLQLSFYVSAATTPCAKIYEIKAYELGD